MWQTRARAYAQVWMAIYLINDLGSPELERGQAIAGRFSTRTTMSSTVEASTPFPEFPLPEDFPVDPVIHMYRE